MKRRRGKKSFLARKCVCILLFLCLTIYVTINSNTLMYSYHKCEGLNGNCRDTLKCGRAGMQAFLHNKKKEGGERFKLGMNRSPEGIHIFPHPKPTRSHHHGICNLAASQPHGGLENKYESLTIVHGSKQDLNEEEELPLGLGESPFSIL